MSAFCLVKSQVDKFLKGIQKGEINPDKLSEMSSKNRHEYLSKYVGEENALQVNSLFESKLLLKNQQTGMINWAKKVGGLKPEVRRDIISKIEKLDKVLDPKDQDKFLKDLATTKLGVEVTPKEAKTIFDMTKKIEETKTSMQKEFTFKTEAERLAYGKARIELANYINDLKGLNKITLKSITDIGGMTKSIRASMDNSAIFRQGWKTLWTHPLTWAKNALTSFKDIVRTFGGKNVMDEVMADRMSRKNELNGNYQKMGLAISKPEEAYPSALPEKIPLLGRAYKASETAFTGFVYRQRMDIADKYIQIAEKSGVDLTPKELKSIGSMVNSLTARGNLGRYEPAANLVNNVFFSPRFVKAQIDSFLHPLTGAGGSNFVRKQAAINLVKVVAGTAAVLAVANAVKPGSVEKDPRSSDFGKIKVGNTRFDVTGGMGSLVTLASRLITMSSKSSTTQKVTQLNSGDFGSQTGADVVVNFFENKFSPALSVLKDIAQGKDFNGNKLTIQGELANLFVPLSISTFQELKSDPNSANIILAMIADGLGIATNTYGKSQKDWTQSPTKAQSAFQSKVGNTKFKQANTDFNTQYDQWFSKTSQTNTYKNLSDDAKQTLMTNAKDALQTKIFKRYGFTYKTPKKTSTQKQESSTLKRLLPK